MSQQPISAIARIRYICRDCHKAFRKSEVVHLRDGGFMCRQCFGRDTELRTHHGLSKRKLMVGENDAL